MIGIGRSTLRAVRWGLVLAGTIAVAFPVIAQTLLPRSRDWATPYHEYWNLAKRPMWTTAELRDVLDSIDALRDDDARRDLLIAFHEDYLRSFDEQSREIRTISAKFLSRWDRERSPRDRFYSHELFRAEREEDTTPYHLLLIEWLVQRAAIDERFIDSAAALFEDDELSQWDEVIRAWRRSEVFAQIRYPNSQYVFVADLAEIVRAMNLSAAEYDSLGDTIEAYEMELDEALRQWQRERPVLDVERTRLREAARQEARDPFQNPRIVEIETRMRELEKIPPHLTLRHRDRIRNAMPLDRRAAFMWKSGQALHPTIYGPGPADLAIHSLLYESDLDDSRLMQVKSIAGWYHAQIGPVYEQIAQDTERRFLVLDGGRAQSEWIEQYNAWRERAQADPETFHIYEPPTLHLWRKRLDLHEQTCRRLRSLFTPAEFEQLPAAVRMVLNVGGR